MSGKKGMPRYNKETKELVVKAYQEGSSIRELNRQYGISRYAIQSWCGLRKEVELRHAAPLPKRTSNIASGITRTNHQATSDGKRTSARFSLNRWKDVKPS